MAVSLSSIPGICFVAAATLIAEMPEPGLISNRKASALAGLVPYARDSGKKKGNRCISGGTAYLQMVLYQAVTAAIRAGGLREVAEGRRKALEVFVIAAARKHVVIANAMIRNGTMRDPKVNGKVSTESASVETTGETAVDEAKPGGDCKLRKDGSGGETAEPMASARGGPT